MIFSYYTYVLILQASVPEVPFWALNMTRSWFSHPGTSLWDAVGCLQRCSAGALPALLAPTHLLQLLAACSVARAQLWCDVSDISLCHGDILVQSKQFVGLANDQNIVYLLIPGELSSPHLIDHFASQSDKMPPPSCSLRSWLFANSFDLSLAGCWAGAKGLHPHVLWPITVCSMFSPGAGVLASSRKPYTLDGRTGEPSFYCSADIYILSCNFPSHYNKLLMLVSLISPRIS